MFALHVPSKLIFKYTKHISKRKSSQALVAHTCNPSYSGGRDRGLKPAQANSSQNPISKKPIVKRASGVAQGVGTEIKHQYSKKKNQKYLAFISVLSSCTPYSLR
jgi:hypothetical protein